MMTRRMETAKANLSSLRRWAAPIKFHNHEHVSSALAKCDRVRLMHLPSRFPWLVHDVLPGEDTQHSHRTGSF